MTEKKSKAQEDMGLDYDPYKKEKTENPPIHVLLNNAAKIDARNAGEDVDFDAGDSEEEEEEVDPESMTVAELKTALDDAEVEYDKGALKADLVKLYSDYLAEQQ